MKEKIKFIAIATVLSLPALTQAHPLAIANQTASVLSFSINNMCSDDFGTVYENEIKTISEETLNKACSNYASSCEIMGYNAKNCSGKPIGGIKYLNEHSFVVFAAGDEKISITATESSLLYTAATDKK